MKRKNFWTTLLRGTVCTLALCAGAELAARDLIWVGGAEDGNHKWDLTTLNWRVAGDETETPVAFTEGDNVLFDDTAQSFFVYLDKVDSSNSHQFNIGNVVFSNAVNDYIWQPYDVWTQARGTMGTIDKWGAGSVTAKQRFDGTGDFTCHEGTYVSASGSWWVGEYRSTMGSLHDTRNITFMPGTTLDATAAAALGGPVTASKLSILFNGASVSFYGDQAFNKVTFTNCPSFFAKAGNIQINDTLYLRGHGLATHVFGGAGKNLSFKTTLAANSAATIYVDDLTGDGVTVDCVDDLIVSNQLGVISVSKNGGRSYFDTTFRKAGKGTMVLANSSYSSATGDVVVAEGVLAIAGTAQGLGMTSSNWLHSAFGAVAGSRERTVTVEEDGELQFRGNFTTGPLNTPHDWDLVVNGGTLTISNRTAAGFGTLTLNNATFNYELGPSSGWFPSWGLFSVSKKLAFAGSTPYDLPCTAYSDWRDNPYITIGFELTDSMDDEPISQDRPELTNMWSVVDIDVADITSDGETDVTIRLPIREMVNMTYPSYGAGNSYTYNPWQNCRFRGGIRKTGAGALCLKGSVSYTHTTEVAEGVLLADTPMTTSSGVTVDAGAYLGGSSSVPAVTVKDGGGFFCIAGRSQTSLLQVPSLTAEGSVVVRVANPDGTDRRVFNQDVLTLSSKPASVDFSDWTVSFEGAETKRDFAFKYDATTGVVSAFYAGGTLLIFR